MANKKRRCTYCKTYKEAEKGISTPFGFFCGDSCRYDLAMKQTKSLLLKSKAITKKNQDKEHAERKRKLKANDRPFRAKEAQKAFNAYIRKRDEKEPCISCDRSNDGRHQRHASHYRSVGACKSLRFNELNVYASCAQCNSHMSGNITEYRIRLIKKIGIGKVEWLECQNEPTKYSCDELKKIELKYKSMLQLLQ